MPYGKTRRYRKRTTGKRTARPRKRTYRRRTKRAPIYNTVVPKTKIMRMIYHDGPHTWDPGAFGTPSIYSFRANSIYDPNLTGLGHQPMGHDQMALLYAKYIVLGSRITVKIWSADASSNIISICGIITDADTTIGPSGAFQMSEILENNKVSYKYVTHRVDVAKPTTITRNFSAKRFFNVKDMRDNHAEYGAQIGANPQDQAYFHVFVNPMTTTADAPPLQAWVKIEYLVSFSQPKDLTES